MIFVLFVVFVIFLLFYLLWKRSLRHSQPSNEDSTYTPIPSAQPSVPLLGNALEYKKSPVEFLMQSAKQYGGLFLMNLAGMKTYIITSDYILKQFDLMSSSSNILSNNDAISDFGFLYTLGSFNVYNGPNIHKFFIKNHFTTSNDIQQMNKLFITRIRKQMMDEIFLLTSAKNVNNINEKGKNRIIIPDFLHFIRRVILATIINEFLSSSLLEYYQRIVSDTEGKTVDFISDFMMLQDEIETATATAAVLPHWLALIVCLKKCEQHRLKLVKRLQEVIQAISADISSGKISSNEEGIWLRGIKTMKREGKDACYGTYEIAELFIGLLFAAHKNPAIAAGQTLLYLLESSSSPSPSSSPSSQSYLERAYQEVDASSNLQSVDGFSLDHYPYINTAMLETLRLTAHTIGAIRKVISPNGWSIEDEIQTVNDEGNDVRKVKYLIPHGSYVGVSHIVPHLDQRKWGKDSLKFNPDRSNLVEKCKDLRLFSTFSSGAHICPGRHVATIIIRLVVILFLQEFELRLPGSPHRIPSVSFERVTLAQRSGSCEIHLEKRDLKK